MNSLLKQPVTTSWLLDQIAEKHLRQPDIAACYAEGIKVRQEIDWSAVNAAILDRWSKSGLERVKIMAWNLLEKGAISV